MTMYALTSDSQSVEATRTCSFPGRLVGAGGLLERLLCLLVVM